nr:MAG TPA: C2H2 type zinc-finger protein [Caudoviricetes sp.]
MKYTTRTDKSCYCHTCNKDFHYLGINRHVAMHRDKRQRCKVTYTYGDTYIYPFDELGKRPNQTNSQRR